MPNSERKIKRRGKEKKKINEKYYFSFMIVSLKTCALFQLLLSTLKSTGASLTFCGPCLKATGTVSNSHGVAVAVPALSSPLLFQLVEPNTSDCEGGGRLLVFSSAVG